MASKAQRTMTTGPDVTSPFLAYVDARRAEIDAALVAALPAPPVCPSLVAEAMRYAVVGGGKRLRPILALTAADAVARANAAGHEDADVARARARELTMPAACAIEMIHCYSLVHDDLPAMDNDSLRRGRPTLHIVYGEALAILAGDGLLAEAFALLAAAPCESAHPGIGDRKLRVLRCIGQAVGGAGMLGGQAIDLELAGCFPRRPDHERREVDEALLRDMHSRKTGALIRAAAAVGAIMADATPAQLSALDHYAAELGLAFQIVDDLLDEQGGSADLGKTAGKDLAAGKPTYTTVVGSDRASGLAAACVDRAMSSLDAAGLHDQRLRDIAQWVVHRRC